MSASNPNIAIICYSKTGHSRKVADRLTEVLDADIYDLQTPRYRAPFFGYLRAGLDSLRQAPVPLTHPLPDVRGYDGAIICGPIWTSYPAAPLISYMQQAAQLPPATGLILTCGDHSPPQKAYARAEAEFGRAFVAKAAIVNGIEDQPEADARIKQFAQTMRDAINQT